MFRCFFPDEYVDSTYVIDFDRLYQEGYRGLIFDIDNTLVPHGAPADARAIALFEHLKELGFGCWRFWERTPEIPFLSEISFLQMYTVPKEQESATSW